MCIENLRVVNSPSFYVGGTWNFFFFLIFRFCAENSFYITEERTRALQNMPIIYFVGRIFARRPDFLDLRHVPA